MRTIAMLGIISALAFVPTPVASLPDGCTTDADAVAVGNYYVSPDLFVYEESNDFGGLQRGGDNSAVGEASGLGADFFPGCSDPDTILV